MITLKRKGGLVIAESSTIGQTGYPRTGRGSDAEAALADLRATLEADASAIGGELAAIKREIAQVERRMWEEMANITHPVAADGEIITDARGVIVCIVPASADKQREAEPGETARSIVKAMNEYLRRFA